jgi:benzoyl-CoA-dihydrodiol lyase
VRADRAKAWRLVDLTAPPARFQRLVADRAHALAEGSDNQVDVGGIHLVPLERKIDDTGYHYEWVDVVFDRPIRVATLTVQGPESDVASVSQAVELGASWWPLAMARQLDDALLMLRFNEPELGTIVLKTRGSIGRVLHSEWKLAAYGEKHWLMRETLGLLRRTLQRLEVSSRSLFAVIDEGSCFAGCLFELALAADRSYMLEGEPRIALSPLNFGGLEMVNGRTRLAARFSEDVTGERFGTVPLNAAAALDLGLVTFTPDELDWEDEIRLAIEERASLSPDALTGMEANLRFAGGETVATKVFGRLSAWQNWIFTRPNATGEQGALKRYGSGARARFDWERV